MLDEAMAELGDADREAVLLRYFQNQDFHAVARALGVSDDAAQKRVTRAVERLRELLARRGVKAGASGLVVLISANAVLATPVGLATAISTATAMVGTTLAKTVAAAKAIALYKILVMAAVVAGIATTVFLTSPKSATSPHVLWFTFNRDAISVMNSAGFAVVGVTSQSPEEISVPPGARIHSDVRFLDRVRLPANDIEPTTLRIVAQRQGNGLVRCLARHYEGYIAVIVLRYPPGSLEDAAQLQRALHAAYPHEAIELEEDPLAQAASPPLQVPSAEVKGTISARDGRLLDSALVHVVSGLPSGLTWPKREQPMLIIRGGQLEPKVLIVLTQEMFTVTNPEGVPYNVHLRFQNSVLRNIGVGAPPNHERTVQAGEPELFARVSEDLSRLNGYICVVDNPFYALTATDGTFKLPELPAGTYTIEVAHPREGRMRRQMTLTDASTTMDLTLPPRTNAPTLNRPLP